MNNGTQAACRALGRACVPDRQQMSKHIPHHHAFHHVTN